MAADRVRSEDQALSVRACEVQIGDELLIARNTYSKVRNCWTWGDHPAWRYTGFTVEGHYYDMTTDANSIVTVRRAAAPCTEPPQ